jgi:hypothetical protein
VNEVLPSRKKKEAVPMIEGLGDRMLQLRVRKFGMTKQINQSVSFEHIFVPAKNQNLPFLSTRMDARTLLKKKEWMQELNLFLRIPEAKEIHRFMEMHQIQPPTLLRRHTGKEQATILVSLYDSRLPVSLHLFSAISPPICDVCAKEQEGPRSSWGI